MREKFIQPYFLSLANPCYICFRATERFLTLGILSPLRLPISPPGQTAFEPADWEGKKSDANRQVSDYAENRFRRQAFEHA